jgi:hypothetical protein
MMQSVMFIVCISYEKNNGWSVVTIFFERKHLSAVKNRNCINIDWD